MARGAIHPLHLCPCVHSLLLRGSAEDALGGAAAEASAAADLAAQQEREAQQAARGRWGGGEGGARAERGHAVTPQQATRRQRGEKKRSPAACK